MRGEISSQIPLPVILSANPCNDDSGEPALTISIKAPDGSDRRMMFAFHNKPGVGDRSSERDALLHTIERGELPSGVDSKKVSAKRSSYADNSSIPKMNHDTADDSEFIQNPEYGDVFRGSPSHPEEPPSGGLPRDHNSKYPSSGFRTGSDPFYGECAGPAGRSRPAGVFHQPPPPPRPPARDFPRSRNGSINSSPGFETESNTFHGVYEGPARRIPPKDPFRQPPPPPPPRDSGNSRDSYGNVDSSFGFGSEGNTNPYSYDPFPDERVAPQYTRRFEKNDSGRRERQPESEFIYAPPSGRRQRAAPKRNDYGSRRAGGGYSDSDSVPGTIIGLIRSPEEMFRQLRSKEAGDAIPVLLVSLAIFAFGSMFFMGMIAADASAYPYLSGLADMGTLIFVSVEVIIFGAICTALTGVLLHFVSYYEGFDEDIGKALKVAGYSVAPYAVGGLIPFLGIIIAPFWSIYLQYTGMRETYYMESDQAGVAVLVPAAVFVVFFIIMTMFGADNFSIFG